MMQETKHLQEVKFKLDDMVRKISEQKAIHRRGLIDSTRNSIFEKLKSMEKVRVKAVLFFSKILFLPNVLGSWTKCQHHLGYARILNNKSRVRH